VKFIDYLSSLIISKDLFMLISGFILRYRSLKRDNIPLERFFDPKVASVEVKPLLLSKINTVFQFLTLGICISPIAVADYMINALQ
jgi:hypothetical protein